MSRRAACGAPLPINKKLPNCLACTNLVDTSLPGAVAGIVAADLSQVSLEDFAASHEVLGRLVLLEPLHSRVSGKVLACGGRRR